MAVLDPIAAAQRIQVVFLARVFLACHHQGIEDTTALLDGAITAAQAT